MDHPVILNKRVVNEIEKFGRQYYDEAIRICETLPEIPSKFEDSDGTKTSPDKLMVQLRDYLNEVI